MGDCGRNDLDDKLYELNNWQVEHQKKLKIFQEAQKKLLDSEHEKILNSLKTQCYEQKHFISDDEPSSYSNVGGTESDLDALSKSSNLHNLFNFKSDRIQLKDPKINVGCITQFSQCEKSDGLINNDNDNSESYEETEKNKPKRFLRRGEGLARFGMTFDHFKHPPNIYKDKRIKTYLCHKPEINKKKIQSKTMKTTNEVSKKKKVFNPVNKPVTVPVNIYVADNKTKNVNPMKTASDTKLNKLQYCSRSKDSYLSKAPMKSLTLKPVLPSVYKKKAVEEEEEGEGVKTPAEKVKEVVKSPEINPIEKEMKKDERELRMFEMLEGKIGDGCLSPNSSLVARFMEESLCSTPSKNLNQEKDNTSSYLESLRALQRQYLTPEQIERIQEFSKDCLSEVISSDDCAGNEDKKDDPIINKLTVLDIGEGDSDSESSDKEYTESVRENDEGVSEEATGTSPEFFQASKSFLQECVENFERLKKEVKECSYPSDCEEAEGSVAEEKCSDQRPSQREIAIKLQRKALQDNVKNLLNWEGPQRKKQPKKIVKKFRVKSTKSDKSKKMEKEEDNKNYFASSMLKDRLNELEKEIEIFKRENRALIQSKRECESEKARLEKERKEMERQMEAEKGKFEARMSEEQKKLQRDKNVFEKYCKNLRNQPNKKEREEITNLKKEVEKITEALVTKEARWGASQARLRNQIKSLEKENAELKAELEKLKKQTMKKVTFENEKNINTKIINAINTELGKLKPYAARNEPKKQKYQCMTARVDSNLPKKPIRRIKSVPDLKKLSGKGTQLNANSDENQFPAVENNEYEQGDAKKRVIKTDTPPGKPDKTPETEIHFPDPSTRITGTQFGEPDITTCLKENLMETVLRETFFEPKDRGDSNSTNCRITGIKRRLESLNLLRLSDPFNGEGDRNETGATDKNKESCGSGESSESVEEEEEEEEEEVEEDDRSKDTGKKCDNSVYLKDSSSFNYLCQTKVDHNGIREKTYDDGRREIIYPNGNIKKISADARIVKMIYYNGDLKETDVAEGSEKYFYAETKTWHTTYKDGLEVLEFPNGQTERRHPDGSTEILFPNGCVRYCDFSGKDEWRFLDGTVIKTDKNGNKVLLLPNGQKEIHTKEYKRREYPDGTVKLLYADGTQETRYATGRVRLKDKDGNLVMDSGGIR